MMRRGENQAARRRLKGISSLTARLIIASTLRDQAPVGTWWGQAAAEFVDGPELFVAQHHRASSEDFVCYFAMQRQITPKSDLRGALGRDRAMSGRKGRRSWGNIKKQPPRPRAFRPASSGRTFVGTTLRTRSTPRCTPKAGRPLRAAQKSGLPCSSDRRAPDPSRQSADGCALGLGSDEVSAFTIAVAAQHLPPDASALWSTFGRGSALATRCPSSLPLCFRHHQQIVGS